MSMIRTLFVFFVVLQVLSACKTTGSSEQLSATPTGVTDSCQFSASQFLQGQEIKYCPGRRFHLEVVIAEESLATDKITGGKYKKAYWRQFVSQTLNCLSAQEQCNPADDGVVPGKKSGTLIWMIHYADPTKVEQYSGSILAAQGRESNFLRAVEPRVVDFARGVVHITQEVSHLRDSVAVLAAPVPFFENGDRRGVFACVTSPDITFKNVARLTSGPYKGQENVVCVDPGPSGISGIQHELNTKSPSYTIPLVRIKD